ncbi:unnamed protein product [Rodentolepis nana]|uniref:Uncharacterized protein n=1 Tax=Rodentolepis nana TaxID=102285 RepID=A0A0R3TS68_RODNA|nr:unnamed protein product [Rodentolepis nana]
MSSSGLEWTRHFGHFRSVLPTPPRASDRPTHISKDLNISPFVFVRVDTVKKSLQPPYDGPYKVLRLEPKFFVFDRNGIKDSVSIDRLKPAYLETSTTPTSDTPSTPITHPTPSHVPVNSPDTVLQPVPHHPRPHFTRCGRRVTFPSRLVDFVH